MPSTPAAATSPTDLLFALVGGLSVAAVAAPLAVFAAPLPDEPGMQYAALLAASGAVTAAVTAALRRTAGLPVRLGGGPRRLLPAVLATTATCRGSRPDESRRVGASAAGQSDRRDAAFYAKVTQPRSVNDPIPTGCGVIDEILGGGFHRGAVTQVYGPPAAGKTNVVLSAAMEAASTGGSTLFIDTEGLSADRMEQLATAHAGPEQTVDDLAGRIIISEALSFEEQGEAVQDAADVAGEVELVVLDSATGFYRLERTEQPEGEALRAVARQVTHLLSLARRHDLAVAFTNQVFTDPDSDAARGLGGHTLDHWSGVILRLDRFRGGNRRATLEKHQSRGAGAQAGFKLTGEGLVEADRG